MYAVKLTGTLRVSEEGELEGIDIHEHGAPAYHMEFGMGTSYITTGGRAVRRSRPPEPRRRSRPDRLRSGSARSYERRVAPAPWRGRLASAGRVVGVGRPFSRA